MDHEVFGPLIRQGLEQGLEQGRVEGQLEILLTQIEKRFGAVSPRIRKRLASLDHKQLKAASLRILDAQKPEDLFSK